MFTSSSSQVAWSIHDASLRSRGLDLEELLPNQMPFLGQGSILGQLKPTFFGGMIRYDSMEKYGKIPVGNHHWDHILRCTQSEYGFEGMNGMNGLFATDIDRWPYRLVPLDLISLLFSLYSLCTVVPWNHRGLRTFWMLIWKSLLQQGTLIKGSMCLFAKVLQFDCCNLIQFVHPSQRLGSSFHVHHLSPTLELPIACSAMFTSKIRSSGCSVCSGRFLNRTPKVGPLDVDPPTPSAVASAASSEGPELSAVASASPSGSMSMAWQRTHFPATSKVSAPPTWRRRTSLRRIPGPFYTILQYPSISYNWLSIEFQLASLFSKPIDLWHMFSFKLGKKIPPAPPSRMARPSLHRLDLPGSSPQGDHCTWGDPIFGQSHI